MPDENGKTTKKNDWWLLRLSSRPLVAATPLNSTPDLAALPSNGSMPDTAWSGEPWQSWPLSHRRWSHRLWDANSTTVPRRKR